VSEASVFSAKVSAPYSIASLWTLLAGLASAAMLAAAHIFEAFGYEPCALCHTAREIYWVALTIAAVGFAASTALRQWWIARLALALLTLTFLVGVGIAIYHAGAEWKFWPGPAVCAAGAGAALGGGDLLEQLSKPIKVVPCDEAAWRMFGVSMAGYNSVISFGLMAISAWAAQQKK
jgi:disulfide bond formation protein DsbB